MPMETKKKILLVTYYWPPNGGAGVQRWLKMSKYLVEQGFSVSVYTPENPEYSAYDESLIDDIHPDITVYKRPIWEPYSLYRKFVGGKSSNSTNYLNKGEKNGLLHRLSQWVRGSVFIPDPRAFWVNPSIRYLSKLVKKESFDVVISTGPPHSMHVIALGLKKKFNIPWIADFRDPWTFIDFYDQLGLSKSADFKNRQLEQKVLVEADKIVTVSKSWGKGFEELANRSVDLIYNGYDHKDFEEVERIVVDTEFTIGYFGSMNLDRNPNKLWAALAEIASKSDLKSKLKIKFFGSVNEEVFETLKLYGLGDNVEHVNYVLHKQVVVEMKKVQMLLLVLNNTSNVSGIIPGKVYEYLASKRPILCIGNRKGDGAQVLGEFGTNEVFEHNEKDLLVSFIEKKYTEYLGKGVLNAEAVGTEKYTRETMAKKYAELLREVIDG
jgi:glycosyltransferase involved in cell wall biosynthesis